MTEADAGHEKGFLAFARNDKQPKEMGLIFFLPMVVGITGTGDTEKGFSGADFCGTRPSEKDFSLCFRLHENSSHSATASVRNDKRKNDRASDDI